MVNTNKALLLQYKACKMIFLFILLTGVNSYGQGLLFNSNDSSLNKRTSYDVFKFYSPTFKDKLNINFDLSLWDNEHFGYILNITDKKNNSYSLSYIHSDNNQGYLNFNIDSKSIKIKIPLEAALLKKRNWIKALIVIDLKNDAVDISINNRHYKAKGFDFRNEITPRIIFGKNEHYTDVPSMAIKNLKIGDENNNYFFPLNEWKGDKVYSDEAVCLGYVENPEWLIRESYFWKPIFTHGFNKVAGLNFNEKDQKLFIYQQDSLLLYDLQSYQSSGLPFKNQLPVNMVLGKSIFNPKEGKYYVYEASSVVEGKPSIAAVDLKTLKWETIGKAVLPQQRHHHNVFYNPAEDKLYLFGGYGSFNYYNTFFSYNKVTDHWDAVPFSGDIITPRFFSASGSAKNADEVFIFGGIGNQSGNQIVGGRHYYDLYKVNLTEHTIKKCWEIKPQEKDFVPANNLIFSKDKKFFYVLCYPHELPKTSLRLYKFSVANGTYETVSGRIPVTSEKIETDVNLFFNQKSQEFFCAIQEFTDPHHSVVKIFSLSSPPIAQSAYLKAVQEKQKPTFIYIYVIALVLIAGITGAMIFYSIRRKQNSVMISDDTEPVSVADDKADEKKANAIYLLGEFTVIDKNCKDITYLFSPKIKQLFILILLYSMEDNGITSKNISALLWPEKDVSKSKNIKGVTLNHLRNIINDINGIELTFLNDTYYFKFSKDMFCDYCQIINSIKQGTANNRSDASILNNLDILTRGGLLPNLQEPWADTFKHAYEEALMEAVNPEIKKIYEAGNYKRALEISKVILNIDPFNDLALKYQLKALRRIKGVEYARKVYDQFTAEYKKSLDVEYHVPFDKICTNKVEFR